MSKVRHLIKGQRFGRLGTIELAPSKNGVRWLCQCDCGQVVIVKAIYLRSKNTRSCGCYKKEVLIRKATTHGKSHLPERYIYGGMIERCYNPKNPAFKSYGGRRIIVAWKKFEDFWDDMGPRPSSKHSIDRIDNDGPYFKANCRWATRMEQANNTRKNVFVEFDGQTFTASQLARYVGLAPALVADRLRKGYAVESVISKTHFLPGPKKH